MSVKHQREKCRRPCETFPNKSLDCSSKITHVQHVKALSEVLFFRNNKRLDWFPGLPARCARLKHLGFSWTHQLVFVRCARRYCNSQTAGAPQSRLLQQQCAQENIILNNELEHVCFSYMMQNCGANSRFDLSCSSCSPLFLHLSIWSASNYDLSAG